MSSLGQNILGKELALLKTENLKLYEQITNFISGYQSGYAVIPMTPYCNGCDTTGENDPPSVQSFIAENEMIEHIKTKHLS